jgi:hypothetical protein
MKQLGLPPNIFFRNFIFEYFSKLLEQNEFRYNLKKLSVTLHEDLFTFITIYGWTLLRIKNILHRFVQKIETHVLYPITFFPKTVPFIRWRRKVGKTKRMKMKIKYGRMRIASWITKATDTRLYYATLVFPRQKYLHECASMLLYTYFDFLVLF